MPARAEAPLQVPLDHGRTLEVVREPSPAPEPRYRLSVVQQDNGDRRQQGGFGLSVRELFSVRLALDHILDRAIAEAEAR